METLLAFCGLSLIGWDCILLGIMGLVITFAVFLLGFLPFIKWWKRTIGLHSSNPTTFTS